MTRDIEFLRNVCDDTYLQNWEYDMDTNSVTNHSEPIAPEKSNEIEKIFAPADDFWENDLNNSINAMQISM